MTETVVTNFKQKNIAKLKNCLPYETPFCVFKVEKIEFLVNARDVY